MELYNLEKKSDSTRGRKSLDMKHDPSLLNGLANTKTSSEKISSLVQQMEQQKLMQRNAMNSLFNSNMSPFGSSLPRHLLPPGAPLVGGISTLLGGPAMFSLNNMPKTPGMPGSLFPGLQPGLGSGLLQQQQHTAATTGVTTTPAGFAMSSKVGEQYEGIKLPLKVESPEKQHVEMRSSPQRGYETPSPPASSAVREELRQHVTNSPPVQQVEPQRTGAVDERHRLHEEPMVEDGKVGRDAAGSDSCEAQSATTASDPPIISDTQGELRQRKRDLHLQQRHQSRGVQPHGGLTHIGHLHRRQRCSSDSTTHGKLGEGDVRNEQEDHREATEGLRRNQLRKR